MHSDEVFLSKKGLHTYTQIQKERNNNERARTIIIGFFFVTLSNQVNT